MYCIREGFLLLALYLSICIDTPMISFRTIRMQTSSEYAHLVLIHHVLHNMWRFGSLTWNAATSSVQETLQ